MVVGFIMVRPDMAADKRIFYPLGSKIFATHPQL